MESADRSLFSRLTPAAGENLLAAGTLHRGTRGEILFSETDAMEDIILLTEGFVSLSRSSFQGETRVIFICASGEILNEVTMEGQKPAVTATALTDVVYCRISRNAMETQLTASAELCRAFFASLSQKTRRLYHKVGNDNGTYELKNRLAATLWKLTRDYGEAYAVGRRLAFPLTVNFLASYMGAKRESVSRALSAMKKQGLITHENGVLTVLNMDELKAAIRNT